MGRLPSLLFLFDIPFALAMQRCLALRCFLLFPENFRLHFLIWLSTPEAEDLDGDFVAPKVAAVAPAIPAPRKTARNAKSNLLRRVARQPGALPRTDEKTPSRAGLFCRSDDGRSFPLSLSLCRMAARD